MDNHEWLARLETLRVQFSCLDIGTDIAAMDLMALWGVYCFFSRLTDG